MESHGINTEVLSAESPGLSKGFVFKPEVDQSKVGILLHLLPAIPSCN